MSTHSINSASRVISTISTTAATLFLSLAATVALTTHAAATPVYIESGADEMCSGTLISQTHVLTARHCNKGNSIHTVIIGDTIDRKQSKPIAHVVNHPNADIAVITLQAPVTNAAPAAINLGYQGNGAQIHGEGFAGQYHDGAKAIALHGTKIDNRFYDAYGQTLAVDVQRNIIPGDSGAGLKDNNGSVVAVLDYNYPLIAHEGGGATMHDYGQWVIDQTGNQARSNHNPQGNAVDPVSTQYNPNAVNIDPAQFQGAINAIDSVVVAAENVVTSTESFTQDIPAVIADAQVQIHTDFNAAVSQAQNEFNNQLAAVLG